MFVVNDSDRASFVWRGPELAELNFLLGNVDLTGNIGEIGEEKMAICTDVTWSESLWLLPVVVADRAIVGAKWWPNSSWASQ